MFAQTCSCSKPKSSEGIAFVLLSIPPPKRVEFMRIIEILLTIMIRKQLYLQTSSLKYRNIINRSIFHSLSQEYTCCWAKHTSCLQLHPLEIFYSLYLLIVHRIYTFNMFIDLFS